METISFEELLLKTAFCCMASDGNIDKREVTLIKSLCEKSALFDEFNIQKEINNLVNSINTEGKDFIVQYFKFLKGSSLSEQEELTLIDFAINIINADEQVDYSEIKFFKVIRHNLKIEDERILSIYPDIEQFLEEDIITESYFDKITNQFLDSVELPQFDLIAIDSIDSISKEDEQKGGS